MQFADIIGLEETKQRLVKSVKESRLSHALLFQGKTGSGNLPLALAFAQYIACQNPSEWDSCGKCSSCLKMSKYAHPDLHFSYPYAKVESKKISLDFVSEWRETLLNAPYMDLEHWMRSIDLEKKNPVIYVDEATSINSRLVLKSYEGGYKFMIIWMPEHLHTSAANKLLKIIEEPPEKTLFFLVTNNAENIINTILSRTQLVRVDSPSDQEVITGLVEKFEVAEESASYYANLAEGDFFKALLLANDSNPEDAMFETFVEWMRICYKPDLLKMVTWTDQTAKLGREEQKHFLEYALHMVRQCIVGNYTQGKLVRLTAKENDFASKFGPFINHHNVMELTALIDKAHTDLTRNVYGKFVFMDLSIAIFRQLKKAATVD